VWECSNGSRDLVRARKRCAGTVVGEGGEGDEDIISHTKSKDNSKRGTTVVLRMRKVREQRGSLEIFRGYY
jgi:hypothetical protein